MTYVIRRLLVLRGGSGLVKSAPWEPFHCGLAVRIPKITARNAHFKEGDAVELVPSEDKLEIRKVSRVPALTELVSRITPENSHGETVLHAAVGKEIYDW